MTELEALRKVAEAARAVCLAYDAPKLSERTVTLMAALTTLDALPAPAAEGETVTLGVLRARLTGAYTAVSEPSQEDPRDWVHVCNVRFVVPPLPRVPEVVGEVEG